MPAIQWSRPEEDLMNTASILSLTNVTKTFSASGGPVHVLRSINLEVKQSDFVILTGPSGSGKTTLLHIAALLDRPSSGEVVFRGRNVTDMPEEHLCNIRKHEISIVFQRFCLLPYRSALENVLFRFRYMEDAPADCRERAMQTLTGMGLGHIADRKAALLSAGEMQRTAIARAVVHRPSLLLADEPTGNLDEESTASMMSIFHSLRNSGMTILMVTHNPSLLSHGTQRYLCRNGQLEHPSS
jgi:putative ABC transport system ATP-binding protein